MTLQVFSAGLPRTGSASLKMALETLGFAPCYHMAECITRPQHWPMFIAAADGKPVDWPALFDGFQAAADAPACMFYREAAATFPRAKIILPLRDPERWFRSTQETVLSPMLSRQFQSAPEAFNTMLRKIGFHPDDAPNHDKAKMIARFNAHAESVRRAIAPERLLVYDPAGGWNALCAFLDRPVPATPFPHVNSTDEFQAMIRAMGEAQSSGHSFVEGAAQTVADTLKRH